MLGPIRSNWRLALRDLNLTDSYAMATRLPDTASR
jgi:hypothetical protein